MKESIIVDKSYAFALKIIQLYRFLKDESGEYLLSKQILRSGTSIGANVEEAQAAQSKKDFISKNSIALKEARETIYWLRLLKDSNYLPEEYDVLIEECIELRKILTSIIKTSRINN